MTPDWIDVAGAVNMRDVAGLPSTDGRTVQPGRLLRSDNLQDLTPADIGTLRSRGLTDVIDLRRPAESASTGQGPLHQEAWVRIHPLSMFLEEQHRPNTVSHSVLPPSALPWIEESPESDSSPSSPYLAYLRNRPDSVVAGLQIIGRAPGATLVHCAAGKDRTGTLVALALLLVGVGADAVIADYVATGERIEAVLDRLRATATYREILTRPVADYLPGPGLMADFINQVAPAGRTGELTQFLGRYGWTIADAQRLSNKLLG
ncbi:MAG: tyrosine-protein phosphatase [Beutenbergiaceae bacterium]